MTVVFAPDYLLPRGLPIAEFAIVLIFAMTGAMLIAGAADLLLLFLGLELMVLPGYLLAGYHKTDAYSTEGAIKYFLLGSFSSAIFLFGLAFVWGITGTTLISSDDPSRPGITQILAQIVAGEAPLQASLAIGLAFLTTGVAVQDRRGPVPLLDARRVPGLTHTDHGYLSVGPKVGRLRPDPPLFVEALGPLAEWWLPVVMILAALTMTVGNLVALTQDNVKRMLGLQLDRHTGYMLVGLARTPAASSLVSRDCCSTARRTRS
jgi:NADH-quinone oxidoreductase subunit N